MSESIVFVYVVTLVLLVFVIFNSSLNYLKGTQMKMIFE